MKKNIGIVERWIRVIVGIALLSLLFIIQSGWRWLGLIGVVTIVTGLVGVCPLYALLGVSTNKT